VKTEASNPDPPTHRPSDLQSVFDSMSEDQIFFEPQSPPFLDNFLDISYNFEQDFNLIPEDQLDPVDSYLPFINLIGKHSSLRRDLI
jgi:hypothetical protein